MSGWYIAFWYAELFAAGGLLAYGLYRRDRSGDGWWMVLLALLLGTAFVVYGPEM